MKRKNNSRSTQIKVAVIGALAVVLAAVIGILPDSSGKPWICNITGLENSIAVCGSVNIASPEGTQIALVATQDSIAATQTALAQTATPASTIQQIQTAQAPATRNRNGYFCTFYTIANDTSSGCPGIAVDAGHVIPPSSIFKPNGVNETWSTLLNREHL